jgi:hypothetical protein
MINGAVPLHLIEKPAPGTGATLLIEQLLYPALGRPVSAMSEGRNEDEWRKRITAKLLGAPQVVFFDNLRARLDSSALAAAITAPVWEDRMLGKSLIVRVPVRCAWIASGNNPSLSNEIARRTVRIRLDAKVDRPWLRTGFKHENLEVWAYLTIVQHWVSQGAQRGHQVLGMFQDWAAVMGGILEAIEVPGLLLNLHDLYERTDDEGTTWRAVVALWWNRFGDQPVGVADLYGQVVKAGIDLNLGDSTSQRSQRTRLGNLLKGQRDRSYQVEVAGATYTLCIRLADQKRQGANLWRLEPVDSEPVNLVNLPIRGAGPEKKESDAIDVCFLGDQSDGAEKVHKVHQVQDREVLEL